MYRVSPAQDEQNIYGPMRLEDVLELQNTYPEFEFEVIPCMGFP